MRGARGARNRGTEKDKIFCPFYVKTGACRHGLKCSRQHVVDPPTRTLLVPNMWANPAVAMGLPLAGADSATEAQQDAFEDFFAEVHQEMSTYGVIETMHVLDNAADHLVGNVYIKYRENAMATKMLEANLGRFYAGRVIMP